MVDELAITNEIWRRWDEMKITPPMTWAELRKKVEEHVKAGKDPYDILRGPAPSKEWMEKKGFVEAKLPYPKIVESKPDGSIVIAVSEDLHIVAAKYKEEFPDRPIARESGWWIVRSFNPKTLSWVDHSRPGTGVTWWLNREITEKLGLGNPDTLKGLFAGRTLEGYVEAAKVRTLETFKGTTFYFETKEERERARTLLAKHNFYFPDGPEISLTAIDDADYMLELLAYEGFDTSKVMIER